MSRTIDPEGVLTDEEVAYLEARGREDILAQNAAYLIERHGADLTGGDPVTDVQPETDEGGNPVPDGQLITGAVPDSEPVKYRSLNKPELVDLAEQRGLDTDGTKEELIARLEDADAPTPDPQ